MQTEQVPGYCTLCRSRCGTLNTLAGGRLLKVDPDPRHPTGRAICAKGRAAPEIAHSTRRLMVPLRRTRPKTDPDPGWQEISWEAAMAETAERLGGLRDRHGAESVAFAVTSPSGTPISDAIEWIERFARSFGSPNICYATEICNWHKDFAHAFTFGCGMPTPDYAGSDLILLWGHNPSHAWLAQAGAVAEACARGAKLMVVDPRRTGHAVQADYWLRVRPGTDAALALGLIHLVIGSGAFDEEFVRAWTNAPFLVRSDTGRLLRGREIDPAAPEGSFAVYDQRSGRAVPLDPAHAPGPEARRSWALRGSLIADPSIPCRPVFDLLAESCAPYTPSRVASLTWIPEADIRAAAASIGAAQRVSYHAWSGIGQDANATQTERAVAVLYALTGCFDAPGGNVVLTRQPVNRVNPLDLLPEAQRRKALGLAERPLGPPAQGWVTARDLYDAILEHRPYPVRGLVGFGANPMVSQADPVRAEAALRALEFHVHCDLFETPTARFADILLPVNSPWEREALRVGFEISAEAEELIQLRRRMVPPAGQSRSDAEIVFDLATRLGLGEAFFGGDVEAGWNHVLQPLGLSAAELRRHPEGVRRKLSQQTRKYMSQTAQGQPAFATETQRVELFSEQFLRHGYDPLPKFVPPPEQDGFPLTLTSAKNGYYCHSQHRSLASLRRRAPEPALAINPYLGAARGIADGDWLQVRTSAGRVRFRARFDDALHPAVVVGDYGWWQSCPDLGLPGYDSVSDAGSNYNALISAERSDPVSGSVPHRSFPCDVQPCSDGAHAGWTGFRPFRIVRVEREAGDVAVLTLAPADGGALPDYRPGQHITVQHDAVPGRGSAMRSYSLIGPATSPVRGAYRIAVKRHIGSAGEAGAMSGHLAGAEVAGETLQVRMPAGSFVLPLEADFPVVLIAAGIGITPFVSYLVSLLDVPNPPPVVLHYGSRDRASHAFRALLEELARVLPNLSVVDHYSRPGRGDACDRVGRITAASVDQELIARRARFYMCGPKRMLDEVRRGLVERGVPGFEIFHEVFASPPDPTFLPAGASHRVRFARSGRDLVWTPACGTLLSFAEAQGMQPPSGCRVGQCESCAVPVLDGEVRYLSPLEPADAGVCLTCQAVPASDLVLDA